MAGAGRMGRGPLTIESRNGPIWQSCCLRHTVLLGPESKSPREAWDVAISQFTKSKSSRRKGCPKSAYLGLCEAGLVLGIPAGKHGAPDDNRNGRYAEDACRLLLSKPMLGANKKALWERIPEPKAANENGQIDVVVALWSERLLHN